MRSRTQCGTDGFICLATLFLMVFVERLSQFLKWLRVLLISGTIALTCFDMQVFVFFVRD